MAASSTKDAKSLLGEYAGLSDARAETASAVESFVQSAHKLQKKLLDAVESGDFSEIADLDGSLIDKLRIEKQALGAAASNLWDWRTY